VNRDSQTVEAMNGCSVEVGSIHIAAETIEDL
jgi:hypothetical protein